MSYGDAYWGSLIAALIKTLSSYDPEFEAHFQQNLQSLTLDDLVRGMKLVKGRYSNPPEWVEQESLKAAKAFLGIEDY